MPLGNAETIFDDELDKKFNEEIDKAVEKMESLEDPKREEIFNYMYSELTDNLKEQKDEK